ncbi:hypothetical protein [Paenibacillus sp. L3-i20]|uniref:hypothetical protein n=1 Tax=Paenibacillus sp. L3-i20 TaxID=2905833 RepID=UPI001EDE01E0|nr:hypothetical protein [Paenibacillus sp. L3-i20]GKU79273.1 hypothetical protein L3i20_v236700 [Paenibacillus sp. L3-i20]
MARGKRIAEGKTLVVYSTKVEQETRALLDALAKANGLDFGQRELLEEMIPLYMAANPEKARKAQAYIEWLGGIDEEGQVAATPLIAVNSAAAEKKVAASLPKTVQTVRYTGNPKIHLYEPGSKNSTGCGLAGTIDPESITDQEANAVTCGKCRYCRKSVFA